MALPIVTTPTGLPGVLLVEKRVIHDERGYFSEFYAKDAWGKAGLAFDFVQDNVSFSSRGTLRGMHFQIEPDAMGKVVQVLSGAIYDVAVDLRRGSPTYGQWEGWWLDGRATAVQRAIWIPPGFAHGFLAMEDDTCVLYKCTAPYAPQSERTLSYKDPAVGIRWPFEPITISSKDAAAPGLAEVEHPFAFTE
jgi:dTDP-4-dehydrorhamnose 3,5-epimerase